VLKRSAILLVAGVLVSCPAWAAKKGAAKFKSAEVRHFTSGEGVELSPEFPDFLYAQMKKEMQKTGLFEQIIGEDEAVEAADAERSLIVSGNVLEYKKGSVAKEVLIGFGAGRRSLKTHISVLRRSNKEALVDKDMTVKAPSTRKENLLANFLAKKIAGEIKKALAASKPAAGAS